MHPHPRSLPEASRQAPVARPEEVVRSRCRSFTFMERPDGRWTVFLMTYLLQDGRWRGYFSFRSAAEVPGPEVRTADLFVEQTEQEVDARARGLGKPLLVALLDSALATHERRKAIPPVFQRWFRDLLARHAAERAPDIGPGDVTPSLQELRSLYESYRLDQVAHLIALLDPATFQEMVEILLEGRRIDFRARDRFQLAMSVVQELEGRLPLPPFEVWAEDYLAHPLEYERYTHALHREGDLP